MNAIIAHRVYQSKYTDTYIIEKQVVPILINTDSIVSIEPIYSVADREKGSVITTLKETFFVEESYEDVISTIAVDTTLNMIRKIDNYKK